MFDCQRQLLSFLYLGEVMTTVLRSPGRRSKKLSLKRAPLQRDFNKDVFGKTGRKQGQPAHAVFLFYLAGNGCLGQKQVFRLSKEVDCFGYRMPGLVFQGQLHEAMAQVIRKRALCRKNKVVSEVRYTHWEVLAGRVKEGRTTVLPAFFPAKFVSLISSVSFSRVSR